MIVADTDVLIDYLNDQEPAASRIARELGLGTLATTVVNRFELFSGARTPGQQQKILTLLGAFPSLPLGSAAADNAALLQREMERRGTAIGRNDSLIAGIVLYYGGSLLTRNRRHFERIAGLALTSL